MKTIGSAARYVDCFALDEFVANELGRNYDSLRSGGEYSQNSIETVNTDNLYSDDGEAVRVVEEWLASPLPEPGDWSAAMDDTMPRIDLMIEYLFEKGYIGPGLYVIHMWW